MTTYENIGAALADPNSNISRNMETAQAAMTENAQTIDALIAQGFTREQAWAKLLAAMRP